MSKSATRRWLVAPHVTVLTGDELSRYKGLPPGYHYTACMIRQPDAPVLTERQVEVLEYIARGHCYAYVAAELSITWDTVKNHMTDIYSRLGARNAASAVYIAMKLGLIQ